MSYCVLKRKITTCRSLSKQYFREKIVQRKYIFKRKIQYFNIKYFNLKYFNLKKIHFCERQISTKFINFVPAIYFQKNRQNLMLLLSKIDDLPKNTALNSKVIFLQWEDNYNYLYGIFIISATQTKVQVTRRPVPASTKKSGKTLLCHMFRYWQKELSLSVLSNRKDFSPLPWQTLLLPLKYK